MDKMTIIKRGFSSVHRTPSTDFLYLVFTSLSTSSVRRGMNFLKFSIYLDKEAALLSFWNLTLSNNP